MRIACDMLIPRAGEDARYWFEADGEPRYCLDKIAMQMKMCHDHAKRITRRIKADEHWERKNAHA